MDWNIEVTQVLTEYTVLDTFPKIQGIISYVPHSLRGLTPTLQQGCTVRNLNNRYKVMVAPLDPQYVNPLTSRKKPQTFNESTCPRMKNHSKPFTGAVQADLYSFPPSIKKKILSFLDREKKKTFTHPSLPSVYSGKKTNRETTCIA